jgi:carboxyl-terminal processing protease
MGSKVRSAGLVILGAVGGVLVSLAIGAMAQRDNRGPLPLEELRQFSDVFTTVRNNYVEPVDDKTLISNAISGMLSNLDPHSAYLDADAFREMQNQTQGQFGGLGIEVGTEDGFVKVIAPIEDTPAARAGILAGDLIIRIDDRSTKGMLLNDAVKLMRGKPQTEIKLTIQRKGVAQPLEVKIVRDVIRVQSVRSRVLDEGVGYIRISQFQEQTGPDLVRHLERVAENGVPKALVLDLRNDPGGLLHSAIGVSAAFLPRDVLVVSTDGRAPDARRRYHASPSDYARGPGGDYLRRLPDWARTVPMVVLVNAGSASASEIVAGALQDHKRATVIGTRTFGKGSVQVILPISRESAIKLTTSRYYTPSGRSIQAKGIEPDLHVTETPEGDLIERPREANLTRHLNTDRGQAGETPARQANTALGNGASGAEPKAPPKPIEFGSPEDFQLQQAINHLKGRPVQVSNTEAPAAPAVKP